MTFNGRSATTAVMLALFSGACILSLGLPTKAAFMPLLIGVPGALLCAAQLVIDLRRAPDPNSPPKPEPTTDGEDTGRSELEVFIWLGLFFAALLGFGFVVGAPLIVFAYIRFSSHESWLNAAVAGLGTLAVMYGIFIWLLELSLFPGLVLEKFL